MVPQSFGPKGRYSWVFQQENIAEFSWCLGEKIFVENPDKLTPLNGASLFGKKKKEKNAWRTIVSSYLVLLIFVYVSREMGSNKEMEPKWLQWRSWLTFRIILLCSLASGHRALCEWLVNFGVCTIHKNCACAK